MSSGLDSVESNLEEDAGLGQDNNDIYQSNEEGSKTVDDSGEQNTSYQKGHKKKKQRMTWTPELHQKFEKAIGKIGSVDKAVPKLILKRMQEDMNVEGLTRNNVASHLQKYRQNGEKMSFVSQETREDSCWPNAGPNTALPVSKSVRNSSFGLHTRVPYFTNDQAAANTSMPQYPSNNYLTMNNSQFMTNPLANLPYTDSFHQPQQQQQYQHQQYYNSSLQLPSVISKQESAYVSAAMEVPDLINNQNSPFFDYGEYFPPGLSNFDQINQY